MAQFGFTYGGSYTSQSPNVADLSCMNFYQENTENEPAASKSVLYPTGGLLLFSELVDVPVRGIITAVDRAFAVAGSRFYEILANGTKIQWGIVINDSQLVHMTAGTTQILISSAGFGYVFDFSTNTFTQIPLGTLLGQISFVAYVDGYFIALLDNSNQFQISQLLNALVWNPADTAKVSVFVGNVLAMIGDHREIWFFGERQTQVYTNTGNALFPFEIIPGAFIEAGIFSPNSLVQLDNSLFWIGGDDRGACVAWRASGYTPTRVSNHAVEFAWQVYLQAFGPTGVSGAVAYSFQDQGHSFWQIYFPVPKKTWVFDVATGLWHERGTWMSATASFIAHHSWVHTFNFGKHLVGDWASGKVYDMAIAYYDDDGMEIRRVRRAPVVNTEQKYSFHSQIQVYLESGLGPIVPLLDGAGQPRGPMANLRWSDDGGKTWSNLQAVSAGKIGEYSTRVIWRRLGRSRGRIYEFSVTDPIPWRITDSYLEIEQGSGA